MKTFLRLIGTALKWGVLGSTLGFVGCILLQIFARLALTTAPSWTEEAARLFFVLAVGFAAGPALRSGEYVNFDFLVRRMPPAWRYRVGLLIDLAVTVLFVVFTVYAARFTAMGWAERSPSLKFPMAFAFVATLVLGLSVLVYAADRLRRRLTTKRRDP